MMYFFYFREHHNAMKFSTFDNDNDFLPQKNCAQVERSGWWFNDCGLVNLNAVFAFHKKDWEIYWNWRTKVQPEFVEMKIRRK